MNKVKVTVVGVGNVGSCVGFVLAQRAVCDEIVLVDIRTEWAIGQALDIVQSVAFSNDCHVKAGPLEECEGSDVVVIAAGKARSPEIKTRLDLAANNAQVIRSICPTIKEKCPNAVIITISNPMDVMNYLVWHLTGFPRQRVVGSGGMLDSSRACWMLGDGKSTSIDCFVLGEHGDGQAPVFSRARRDGAPITLPPAERQRTSEALRMSSMAVVSRKEATTFAPAANTVSMIQAILGDKKVLMPCSAILDGEYGLKGLSIGVPVVLGRGGIERIEQWDLDEFERERFYRGARVLQDMCRSLTQ
ncbi:MAG: malate dehydrogenase [Bacteroidetes bacterium]|nr:malate dehydrogenase [Bacteroidota bacterium]MCL5026499.1 malate dehydrogenase [Chloroflexota bacterium]